MNIKFHAKVIHTDDAGTQTLADFTGEKDADAFATLKTTFEQDMRLLFPQDAYANVEYFIKEVS